MPAESIEARTHELMSMQKVELARRVAEYEDAHAVYSTHAAVFAHSEPAPVIEQGTDPEIIDVAPASTEPEVLEPLDGHDPEWRDQAEVNPSDAATIEGADAAQELVSRDIGTDPDGLDDSGSETRAEPEAQ